MFFHVFAQRSHATVTEWVCHVIASVDGYQDHIVLCDLAWIDEAYVNDTDLNLG